jgi:hypothetical protein
MTDGISMPQLPSYIPPRNAQLVAWAANFAALISASPSTYGLVASDATVIATQNTALQAAYALISSPSTKTAATVSAFNTEKVTALATFRPYAQTISLNAGVSTSAKIAVGVNPRTSGPTPITAPTTAPVLTIQSTSTAGSILRYRDATASPSVKAKPYGVVTCQIWALASATPITDPTALTYNVTLTKSPAQVVLGAGDAGKTVYFAARWLTRKGLTGPWSSIVNYVVAG